MNSDSKMSLMDNSTADKQRKLNALLARTRKRKLQKEKEDDDIEIIEKPKQSESNNQKKIDINLEDDKNSAEEEAEKLRQKAAETLMREAKRASQRAEMFGPQGWLKPRSANTNKAFLARTLKSVELDRREREENAAGKTRSKNQK